MFCENCGKQIRDDAKFCTYCGAQTESFYTEYRSPEEPPVTVSNGAKGAAISAMVWGIVALATCQLPFGFIVGIVGLQKYRWAETLGMTTGMAKAGRIMSIFGIVLGALFSIYWIGACTGSYY